jgi:hypothetical protein
MISQPLCQDSAGNQPGRLVGDAKARTQSGDPAAAAPKGRYNLKMRFGCRFAAGAAIVNKWLNHLLQR